MRANFVPHRQTWQRDTPAPPLLPLRTGRPCNMRRLVTIALLLAGCGAPVNYDVLTPAAAAERIRLKANSLILAAEEAAATGDVAQLAQWETMLDDVTSAYFRGAK